MRTPEQQIKANLDRAACILQAIVYATDRADEDCGKVEESSNWLLLIEAAASHAHYLITGTNLDELARIAATPLEARETAVADDGG